MKYSLFVFVILMVIACDDVPEPRLLGKWQLKTVEKNGAVTTVDTVWYNFQSASIFSLQVYITQSNSYQEYIGMRTQVENVISILIENTNIVDWTDWRSGNRSFTIDKANKRSLLLRSEEGYLYSFIKF